MNPGTALKIVHVLLRMHRNQLTFVSYNVTNRCNARCPMCMIWRTPCEELGLEELDGIFHEFRRRGFLVIELSGGEPFLRKDIFEIFALLDRIGLLYTVTSNGAVITPEQMDRLAEARGLLQLGISLDSLSPDVYLTLRGGNVLPAVLGNIDRLRNSGLKAPLKVNFTMSRLNFRETFDVLDFARSRRIYMSAFPVNQGEGFCHRSGHSIFTAGEDERRGMRDAFLELARLRRKGEPLWEFSGFYEQAASFVMGGSPGPCDAGRIYLDMHADGKLAVCIDQQVIADLRTDALGDALRRLPGETPRIERCYTENPCFYTCTTNISVTARNEFVFLAESLWVRMRTLLRPIGTGS